MSIPRRLIVPAALVALLVVACSSSGDPSNSEEPTGQAEQPATGCSFYYPGTWGCYGDNWCNSRCRNGDFASGSWFSCVKKPTHWETVCVCCE